MDWLEGLTDEELKGDSSLKKFDSVESLAKSYKELEAYRGNSLRVPSEEATSEDRAKFYNKLMERAPELMLRPNPESPEQMKEYYRMIGVPEGEDAYGYDGDALNSETVSELRKLAEKHKFTKQQWAGYLEDMSEMQGATVQMREDARVRMGAELKTEWGMAFEDRYAVVEKYLNERPGLGGIEQFSPSQIKTFYTDAISLVQRPQAGGQPSRVTNRLTPSEAQAQLKEIENNPTLYSFDPQDRQEQQRLTKKRIDLMKEAYPEKYS